MEATQVPEPQVAGSVKELELNHANDPSIQPVSHGIENAPNDPEMISIATSDAMEFGVTPLNGQSPASPSVANSLAAAMADESSVSPIGAAGGSAESSLGNFSQGAGASGVPLFNNLSSKISRTSEVTTVLKTLSVEVEKLKQTGKSQIDLELPISETESVKIRLQVRGDEIRSVFITESPELRNALQKSWGDFAQTSRERGFRFGDPTFQNPSSQNNSANQQGQEQRQSRNQQTDTAPAPYPAYNISRQQPQRTTTSPAPGNSVSLWA
jgi:flagellar hook-length control protein FliK